jgi:hypothetical protein
VLFGDRNDQTQIGFDKRGFRAICLPFADAHSGECDLEITTTRAFASRAAHCSSYAHEHHSSHPELLEGAASPDDRRRAASFARLRAHKLLHWLEQLEHPRSRNLLVFFIGWVARDIASAKFGGEQFIADVAKLAHRKRRREQRMDDVGLCAFYAPSQINFPFAREERDPCEFSVVSANRIFVGGHLDPGRRRQRLLQFCLDFDGSVVSRFGRCS